MTCLNRHFTDNFKYNFEGHLKFEFQRTCLSRGVFQNPNFQDMKQPKVKGHLKFGIERNLEHRNENNT